MNQLDRYHHAVIQRVSGNANRGALNMRIAPNMHAVFNRTSTLTLIDVFAQWAHEHDGRVLVPLSNNFNLDNLRECDLYAGVDNDGNYVAGHIAACGRDWQRGTTHVAGYEAPDRYLSTRKRFWLALDHVEQGVGFDFSSWVATGSRSSEYSPRLDSVWAHTKSPSMYAYGTLRGSAGKEDSREQ